jgi:hypothetical protein
VAKNTKRTSYATINGLQDFLKDMGVVPAQMQRAESVFQAIAAATVVTTAKEFAANYGAQQQKYAQTLRAMGKGTVAYGGEAGALGAEFGALVYKQFPEWRGNKDDAGYFFWPAIREFRDEDMINLWVREVWAVVQGLFSN